MEKLVNALINDNNKYFDYCSKTIERWSSKELVARVFKTINKKLDKIKEIENKEEINAIVEELIELNYFYIDMYNRHFKDDNQLRETLKFEHEQNIIALSLIKRM